MATLLLPPIPTTIDRLARHSIIAACPNNVRHQLCQHVIIINGNNTMAFDWGSQSLRKGTTWSDNNNNKKKVKCCAINQGSIEKSILGLAQQGRRKIERSISRDESAPLIGCVISALSLGVMRTKVITCEGGKSGCIRSWTVCWCVHLPGNAAANKLSLSNPLPLGQV